MQYRLLGKCGMKVSQFGLGGWTTFGASVSDEGVVKSLITRAFDAGIILFDIADVYAKGQTEIAMGKVLRDFPRHELVITSKVFFPMSDHVNDRGLSRKHIFESVHKSLKRIGTDYLDIYFCHRHDPDTPLEETARAMDDLIHQGKTLYWGTSEWTSRQVLEVHNVCNDLNLYRPQVEQPQYSLLARDKFEHGVRDTAMDNGMGVITWSPLAYGILTGKYDRGLPANARLTQIEWLREGALTEDRLEAVRRLKTISDQMGCTRAQIALAWVSAQLGISGVLLGVTRMEQLEENLGALRVKLDKTCIADLDKLFPSTGRLRS